ncbi:GH22459 [Drosophila grimshawi]|uniref:GH22459 n=1 Tax=Drosophila grimshawi TaxID=7222 RepID=B4JSI1_DROGR|nr:GH22459 [Drosophila grimshawi]
MPPKLKVSELKKLYEERWQYPPAQKPTKIKFIACGDSPNYENEKKSYSPCWKSPMAITADLHYGPCWDYPPKRYRRHPLPSPCRGTIIPANAVVPSFKHCETPYSRCDFRLEQCVQQQILLIETLFRDLESQHEKAKELQIEMTKELRDQAIRRRLLIGSACGIKIYPEYLSQMAEQQALCEFQKAHNAINTSNAELAASVLGIRNAMPELRARLDKLDRTLKSPFVLGLKKVLQTIQDLYDYFFEVARKYKTWAQLIDAAQQHSIEDYLQLLSADMDFESFKRAGTENCTCKRCSNKNPLEPYLPCWCQGRDRRDKSVRLVQTDYQCHKKIYTKLESSDSSYGEKQSDTSLLQQELHKLDDD